MCTVQLRYSICNLQINADTWREDVFSGRRATLAKVNANSASRVENGRVKSNKKCVRAPASSMYISEERERETRAKKAE